MKSPIKPALWMALALVLTSCWLLSQQPASSVLVVVEVTDPTGAPIPHAYVRIVPYRQNPHSGKPETSGNGTVPVQLVPAAYEVFVRARGFRPASATFRVDGNAGQVVKVPLAIGGGSSVEIIRQRSAADENIQALEAAYWQAVESLDLDSYRKLWQAHAVASRDGSDFTFDFGRDSNPVDLWLKNNKNGGSHLEEYDLGDPAINVSGDVAVAYYTIRCLWVDGEGRGKPTYIRLGHTWIRTSEGWKLVGEMETTVGR